MQEALLAAALQWPADGVPDNPRGWLIQVAARRMTDQLRSELARRRRETVSVQQEPPDRDVAAAPDSDTPEHDDTLQLLFMCCHPVADAPIGDRAHACAPWEDSRPPKLRTPSSCRKPRWRSGSAARSRRSRSSGIPFGSPGDQDARRTPQRRPARPLSDLQRGLREQRRRRPRAESTCRRKPSAWRARSIACGRTTARSLVCWRSCCSPTRVGRRGRGLMAS